MNKYFTKDFSKDYYKGIKGIYFHNILKKIIEIGHLDKRNVRILDFGCGLNKFKSLLPNVIGYDIQPRFTEIDDWKKLQFDVVITNAVFLSYEQGRSRDFFR